MREIWHSDGKIVDFYPSYLKSVASKPLIFHIMKTLEILKCSVLFICCMGSRSYFDTLKNSLDEAFECSLTFHFKEN